MISLSRIDIQRMNNGQGNASGGTSVESGGGNGIQVQESGTGNAYTGNTYESGILTLNKDKTFVDTDTNQTIGGTKTFSNTVWGEDFRLSSDQRLKNFKNFIKLGLEQIANAPIVEFTWNDKRDENIHGGTYAQYWKNIAPWAIGADENGYLGVSYDTLSMAAVVQLAREVVALKKEIEELKKSMNH